MSLRSGQRDEQRWSNLAFEGDQALGRAVRELRARTEGGRSLEVARQLEGRLQAELQAPSMATVPASSLSAAALGGTSLGPLGATLAARGLWWLMLVGGIGAIALTLWIGTRAVTTPATTGVVDGMEVLPAPHRTIGPVGHPATAPAIVARPTAEAPPRQRPTQMEKPAPTQVRAARRRPIAPPRPTTVDAEAELALLDRAQRVLARDPEGALALAQRHAEQHPRGVFTEEREVLALEAELQLRRHAAALARARRFERRFPNSTHSARVREVLEHRRAPSADGATISQASDDPIVKPIVGERKDRIR